MNNTINPMLTKLRLSGMNESLEVRLHEASSTGLTHLEFFELILQDEMTCSRFFGHLRGLFWWDQETKAHVEIQTLHDLDRILARASPVHQRVQRASRSDAPGRPYRPVDR